MASSTHQPAKFAARWTNGILAVFTLLGFGFGSWLSRLPAVRDHLGASTLEMSILGLILAGGSVTGLMLSGRNVSWLGSRRTLTIGVIVQLVAMPAAATFLWFGALAPAVACLALFGFSFSTSDVAMNVSGANAERALGKPRMPLLHAGFSLGSVAAMGVGAVAEASGISVPLQLGVSYVLIAIGVLFALRTVPRDESAVATTHAAGTRDAGEDVELTSIPNTHTGPIPVIARGLQPTPAPRRSPWRDPRVLAIGLIAMSMSLAEGTASDWMPLALADGRGLSNSFATVILGIFFISMMLTRIAGAWLLTRFGRVPVLRVSGLLVVAGVAILILVPALWACLLGAVLWGVGAALGFPVGISAAADNPATAVRDVATVSAIAYTAFLLGPMLIGFLGEHFGLLNAFWPIAAFAVLMIVFASAAREPGLAASPPRDPKDP